MELKTEKLFKHLDSKNTTWSLSTSSRLESEFDITPHDFIRFAEEDLTSQMHHKYINALSNSKRALDCQCDLLLLSFGFYKISQSKMWGFPTKLNLIENVGLLAPRILRKINKQRNLLEHRFVKPTPEQVEDILDISMLFIASTDKYIMNFKSTVCLKSPSLKKQFIINNDYKNCRIGVREYEIDNSISTEFMTALDKDFKEPLSKEIWCQGEDDYISVLKKYIELAK